MRALKAIWAWLLGRGSEPREQVQAPVGADGVLAAFVEELPEEFLAGTLYVAGGNGQYWCAGMRCPCGCGESIHLSLVKRDKPAWRVKVDAKKRASLFPSVWRTSGCRSHFILRQGEIRWCRSFG